MVNVVYRALDNRGGFYALLALLGAFLALGAGAFLYMEHSGHVVTGMDNQIVWGMPHVFAVFLIVAASGALNVASTASVFGKAEYKPLAPLSGLLAFALLLGGLTVLMLDLGRSDRLIVAMTYYNFKSIFALNVILYTGFFAIVAAYLWTMMERRMNRYSKPAGLAAFIWRLSLTTGTGSIFGFLVAREAYDSALLAPMFIVFSFAYGTAIFLIVLMAACRLDGRPLGDAIVGRLKNLLGTFVAASLYFTAVFHLTKLYVTKFHGIERFILLDGGIHTTLFWLGQVLVGGVAPLVILFHPLLSKSRGWLVAACLLIVAGGLAQMFVTIIGAQAYPLSIFPGYEVSSSFFDGKINGYAPSLPETFLGMGGVALALAAVAVGVKVLRFLPENMDDAAIDPHHAK
ncbi:MAG: polysulfide reductase NrfD [Rhodocyclales bacterium]|nr:polysulfide reductase NrfD [Rhodocyclales bacterium]